ncbi:MAG: DUF3857 and transglutaminase domain-containing protein [Terracidiphilus sp.]|nr:DUF3857 and transglutaminase domain-containing protein [Terracidiphilus sp.]
MAQFQQPTDEELKMTTDPKAPGAAAVYLNREETTEDSQNARTIYERIKVLTEKGKELATIRIPYARGVDTVADIQGRTIHADGTVIPLTAKPADLMDYKVKDFQVNTVVFTLPSVEVGSILEYRLKIHTAEWSVSEPAWNIQQNYFVHKAHYSYHPSVAMGHYISDSYGTTLDQIMYSVQIGNGARPVYDKHKNIFSLDIDDVPAAPDEDWMPPLNTIKWTVRFYYTSVTTGTAYWQDAGKHWAKFVQEFANPTGGLKKVVAGIIAANDTDEQKAVKIYAAVMKIDNADFSRQKSEVERKKEKLKDINKAEDVWKQQSGSGDEIALLYVAMARAAGLKVWPAKVVNRDHAIFDASYLSLRQLDDYIAIVLIDGKEVYLDPGQKMCPYGTLHWKHTLTAGLRLTDKGTDFAVTPVGTYKNAVVQRTGGIEISEDGNVTGSIRIVMNGPDALRWRQLALENDLDEVKKRFNESMKDSVPDGARAEIDHFLAMDDYNSVLMAIVNVSGNLGSAAGKHFFLPGLFFESHAKHPFVAQEKRATPIDVEYPRMEKDDVVYTVPPGFKVESAPQTDDVSWPGFAILRINSVSTGKTVEVVRIFARNFAILDAKVYNDVRNFYLKQATADQQQIVLTRAEVAKGN